MKKNTQKAPVGATFKVRVVYGFLQKLEIVLLGELLEGQVELGQTLQLQVGEQLLGHQWQVREILHMDFINAIESSDFMGLVVACHSEESFKLLQALRVYDETLYLKPSAD
jgi:hypothetical protein